MSKIIYELNELILIQFQMIIILLKQLLFKYNKNNSTIVSMDIAQLFAQNSFNEYRVYFDELLKSYTGLMIDFQRINFKNKTLEQLIVKKTKQTENLQIQLNKKKNYNKDKILQNNSTFCLQLNRNSTQKKRICQNYEKKSDKNSEKTQKNLEKTNEQFFKCPYQPCDKLYFSDVSLNLHIKIKHNGGSKKQRQAFGRLIMQSEEKGVKGPGLTISLPPNFIEDFRLNHYLKTSEHTITK